LRLWVGAGQAGARLLHFIEKAGGVSRDEAERALAAGGVFVGRARVRDAGARVRAGDEVRVRFARTDARGEVKVLARGPDWVAVHKPAGVAAQATPEGEAGTLPALVAAALGRPVHLVHRLDRDTTGVTLFALNEGAARRLMAAFREGRAEKVYLALAVGELRPDEGVVDLELEKDPAAKGRWRAGARGVPAVTRWRVVERLSGATLVELRPETGRTHQIRAHLSALGHPILGDARYGAPRALTLPDGARVEPGRMLLHAVSLRVGEGRAESPLPEDFAAALAALR
jgi:23S rRNA pseudouridine1911/1915/1917 synthase